MPVRGGTRAVPNGRGRRIRGTYRGWPNCAPPLPHGYDHPYPDQVEMDFTEDVQMPSSSQQQHWEGGNMESGERKRNGVFIHDHYSGTPSKKSRGEPSVSLLPTPPRPPPSLIRGPPLGTPFPVRPGFRPPPHHQEMMTPPPPPLGAGRYFGGGPHPPRGSMRPMMGLPPRGPPPTRFMTPPFNRPGPPPMPPPMGYRPNNPHARGAPLPRGGPFPGRGFGGPPRMYRP